MSSKPGGRADWNTRAWIIAVLFVLAVGLGAWYTLSKKTPEAANNPSGLSSSSLGLKLTLSGPLKGTVATIVQPPTGSKSTFGSVNSLQLNSYTTLANKCLGMSANTKQYFANLIRVTTLAPGMPKPLRQVSGAYIVNLGASLPSNVVCKDKDTQQQLDALTSQLNNSLTQAVDSAKTN